MKWRIIGCKVALLASIDKLPGDSTLVVLARVVQNPDSLLGAVFLLTHPAVWQPTHK